MHVTPYSDIYHTHLLNVNKNKAARLRSIDTKPVRARCDDRMLATMHEI